MTQHPWLSYLSEYLNKDMGNSHSKYDVTLSLDRTPAFTPQLAEPLRGPLCRSGHPNPPLIGMVKAMALVAIWILLTLGSMGAPQTIAIATDTPLSPSFRLSL